MQNIPVRRLQPSWVKKFLPTNLTALNKLYTNASPTTALLGWKELWVLSSNKDTKTKTITDLLKSKRKQQHPTDAVGLENLLRSIYSDIPASALTATDRTTLNLPLRKAPTKAVKPITSAVLSLIEQGHLFAFIKLGKKAEGVKTREIWSAVVPHGTAITPTTVFTSFTDWGRTIYDFHFTDDQVGQDLLIKTRDKI